MINQFILNQTNRRWIHDSAVNSYASRYIERLKHQGYGDPTIKAYARSLAHFAHWLTTKRIPLQRIDEEVVNRFLFSHLPNCSCSSPCKRSLIDSRASLTHLLTLLRSKKVIPPLSIYPKRWREELMGYDSYLKDVCGLAEQTRLTRLRYAGEFLQHCFSRRPFKMERIKPRDIHRFIMRYGKDYKPGTFQVIGSCIRRYLSFRAFCGDETATLIAAVPSVAQWRLSSVPKSLTPIEIEHVINSFDRTTRTGLRSYAMVRCLVDLGLRASEVAYIQLDDINWREGVLRIKGKGGRTDLLPLPAKTGAALVDYLRHGRPATSNPALFVRHRAPFDQPVGPGGVRSAMRPAFVSCNVNPGMGTHVLRHTTASRMVSAGASLKEIADILRHRCLDTSMVYTKVNLPQLQQVIAPWPRGLS